MYRVGGLIIRDKRLLLVSDSETNVLWTPGGRLDEHESPRDALTRELNEELCLTNPDLKFYHTCEGTHINKPGEKVVMGYYLVFTDQTPQISSEISVMKWVSRAELLDGTVRVVDEVALQILPKLIEDDLL